MNVRDFVKKQEAALKRYQRMYRLLDFIAITLIIYVFLFYMNIDRVFPLLSIFEVRAGITYDILGMNVAFETVALTSMAASFSLIASWLLHLHDTKRKALLLIEEKYPELREKLRTAYDNENIDNLIVADLLSSVSSNIKLITSSTLLIKAKLVFGIILVIVSSSTLVYVVENDVRTGLISPEDIKEMIDKLPFIPKSEDNSDGVPEMGGKDSDIEGLIDDNQGGEVEFVLVEGQEIDLSLPPGTQGGFTPGEEVEERDRDFGRPTSYELAIISSQAYYEELPEGYEQVVKSYFEEMAKK